MNIPLKKPRFPVTQPSKKEPPFFGWRYFKTTLSDGTQGLDSVPLTMEDLLHPQEGDETVEGYVHEKERGDLTRIFRTRIKHLKNAIVTSDCRIDWNVEGVRPHCADVAVFEDLKQLPKTNFGTLSLARSGGRCLLAMEIVSPDCRDNDVTHKLREYFEAGVPLYIIIDQEFEDGPRSVEAYRRTQKEFVKIALDDQNRLLIEPLGLLLGLRDNEAVCWDAKTGEKIPTWEEEITRREAAEKAERKEARERAKAQKKAEKAQHEAEKAQQDLKKEAEIRKELEQRLKEMEAELKRESNQNG